MPGATAPCLGLRVCALAQAVARADVLSHEVACSVWQKRPIHMVKVAYSYGKRGLSTLADLRYARCLKMHAHVCLGACSFIMDA